MENYRIGLDIGSTTAKAVAVDTDGQIVFSLYRRHMADIPGAVAALFDRMEKELPQVKARISVTGSVGMGFAERFDLPFVQEVSATVRAVRERYPDISTVIDIGGEDAKIVYLNAAGGADMRMNGNCAGGTGAFIDQMASLLGVEVEDMNALAERMKSIYPIASRCGVFSKTDVQNLVSKNVTKEDISGSIFRAIAVQTVVTLSHGVQVKPKILFCGGPLNFIPALRRAFLDYMELGAEDVVTPPDANLIPALGTALSCTEGQARTIGEIREMLERGGDPGKMKQTLRLPAIFADEQQYAEWKKEKERFDIGRSEPKEGRNEVWLGIDSGSTTTKIVAVNAEDKVLFSYYAPNQGNPIQAVKAGLAELAEKFRGKDLRIMGSCSTGYGEDLTKAAFNLDHGIIETIAHYASARKITPDVSFILDIGGQDMKAMFIKNGALYRMEINEACSSGCGAFIETFAKSLGYTAAEFAGHACRAEAPCDLGTRCTVFMNSKVKQSLREGASVGDIAAGLSYSVVRNCLYKVLKIKGPSELGDKIVLQGGTMRNDSIVRTFEWLTGKTVYRSNIPELMGAYGCALYAKNHFEGQDGVTLDELLSLAEYATRELHCKGCENACRIQKYTFTGGNVFYSGNKCEKVFSNNGCGGVAGRNVYTEKYALLFGEEGSGKGDGMPVIGIPRCLNMYEEYPFWKALFEACSIRTVLSSPSTYARYESGVHSVMSDNICFPAKLVHSHIYDLMDKGVDRIFMPYVVFEKSDDKKAVNSYNCPIVSGYSDVIRSAVDLTVPVDSPPFTFKDEKSLGKCGADYLKTLGVPPGTVKKALKAALEAWSNYEDQLREKNRRIFRKARENGRLTILLAGRPYHTDPLVQHKISDMVASMGVDVITEDIVRGDESISLEEIHHVSQWAYVNRILRAARWVAEQGSDVHFVQMTSFGCGPDAFLLDQVKAVLERYGKSLTILKIDDMSNIGSLKLRVRSLIESLRFDSPERRKVQPFVTTRKFTTQERSRKIIAPFFTDYISPLLPAFFRRAGYDLEVLPESDMESVEEGLKYANNEICYPATLIVGDIVKALKSGRYDPEQTAVAITQTGGQCRASNYLTMIKSALVDAGFSQVPVVSLAFGSGGSNDQSGFTINWFRYMHLALDTILYGDCISKFYHATLVREAEKGQARALRDHYLERANKFILENDPKGLQRLLSEAALAFDEAATKDADYPKVGVVGEIFLKFCSFAHKGILNWLSDRDIEIVPPTLINFFLQSFVNDKVRRETHMADSRVPSFVHKAIYRMIYSEVEKFNRIASDFRYFTPFTDIFDEARHGGEVVSLSAQFGEGWLLPAEVVSFAHAGVNNVLSLQPFGCIANHIVSKGVEKRIKTLYPQMNLLSLDFDSGVSDVNVTNRLHLMIDNLK